VASRKNDRADPKPDGGNAEVGEDADPPPARGRAHPVGDRQRHDREDRERVQPGARVVLVLKWLGGTIPRHLLAQPRVAAGRIGGETGDRFVGQPGFGVDQVTSGEAQDERAQRETDQGVTRGCAKAQTV
jgi:hypothetical protein